MFLIIIIYFAYNYLNFFSSIKTYMYIQGTVLSVKLHEAGRVPNQYVLKFRDDSLKVKIIIVFQLIFTALEQAYLNN